MTLIARELAGIFGDHTGHQPVFAARAEEELARRRKQVAGTA